MVTIEEVDAPSNGNGKLVPANYRFRAVGSDGQKTFASGQRFGAGFIDSVISAYCNTVYHPGALFCAIFGTFILFAEAHNAAGPFEVAAVRLLQYSQREDISGAARFLAVIATSFVQFLIPLKVPLSILLVMLFGYICKPSGRHLLCVVIVVIVCWTCNFTIIEIFFMSQLFFLFAMLRAPAHKIFILIVFFIIVACGMVGLDSFMVSLQEHHKKLNVTL